MLSDEDIFSSLEEGSSAWEKGKPVLEAHCRRHGATTSLLWSAIMWIQWPSKSYPWLCLSEELKPPKKENSKHAHYVESVTQESCALVTGITLNLGRFSISNPVPNSWGQMCVLFLYCQGTFQSPLTTRACMWFSSLEIAKHSKIYLEPRVSCGHRTGLSSLPRSQHLLQVIWSQTQAS